MDTLLTLYNTRDDLTEQMEHLLQRLAAASESELHLIRNAIYNLQAKQCQNRQSLIVVWEEHLNDTKLNPYKS